MADSLNDIYLRHGINLTRYSNHEAQRLLKILDTSNSQIQGIITKAKAVETKEKYRRIALEIRRVTDECSKQLNGKVEADFKELAGTETAFVEKAMRSVNVQADFELPAPKKIWATASFGSYSENGHETFETYLTGMGENLYKTWDTQVRAGYLAGLTAKQINRAVLGSADGLEPGQMQALRRSLETNTRTMVASMAEAARDAVYKENASLFSGYRYVGTLDSRTCAVCGSADGVVFKTLEEAPNLPQHHNCRCLLIPIVKGMEELDADDTRASEDRPVPATMTYSDWLKTLPDEVVRDILGPTRFGLYKEGMPITSFVADGRVLSLGKMIEKEGLELFGAGLKDKSWQAQRAYSETYYNSIRNRTEPTDIVKIAENTGFSVSDIQSIRNHVFINEHDLGDGEKGRFTSDWKIAQAWQRMEQGWKENEMAKYRDCDLLLLKHELEELTQMLKYGYNTIKAHEIAESKYAWDIRIREIK